jgi:hypothetical protein
MEQYTIKKLNDNLIKRTGKSIEVDTFAILKDDIANYRTLNPYLTDSQKIEIIKLYNKTMDCIKDII